MKKVRKLKIHFVVMNLQEYIILLRTPKDWEDFFFLFLNTYKILGKKMIE